VALVAVYWAGTPALSAGAPSLAAGAPSADAEPAPPPGPAEQPDVGRYCQLSDQLGDFEDRYPDDPEALLDAAGVQLADLPLAAPPQIRDAVTVAVEHLRADAGELTPDPDEAAVVRAEDTIDAFEEEHCP
jgi:hypothetical protein